MITKYIDKYELKILKKGRKWFKVDGWCHKEQLLINDITKDFEVGKTYTVYARKEEDKTKYGTTNSFFAISKEEYLEEIEGIKLARVKEELERYASFTKRHEKTREKIKSIINHEALENRKEELLQQLKEVEKDLKLKECKSDARNLIDRIKKTKDSDYNPCGKIDQIKALITRFSDTMKTLKEKDEDFFNELIQEAFDICESITLQCNNCTDTLYCIRIMKKIFIVDDTYCSDCYTEIIDNITKEAVQEGENLIYKKLDEIEESIAAGSSEIPKMTDYDVYKYMKNNLNDSVNSKVEIVKEKRLRYLEKLQLEKEEAEKEKVAKYQKDESYNYLINNVFELKDKKAFTTTLIANGVSLEESEELFERVRYVDDNVYILTFRLDREMFKETIDTLIQSVKTGDRTTEYISKNPYKLIELLLEKNIISIDAINEDDEVQKIKLWSNEITEPFEYRKEEVYGEIYYFVTKEMPGIYERDSSYNAYYIVGWDKENNSGFSHRIPWAQYKYENMSVKEIVDYIFRYEEGFKRIQGDILTKEYEIKEITEHIITTTRIVSLNEKEDKDIFVDIDSDKNFQMIKDQVENPIKKNNRVDFRKNLYVVGDSVKIPRLNSRPVFINCKVFCNNKEIFSSDTPIEFNTNKEGTRLKYSLYYKEATYNLTYTVEHTEKTKKILVDSNVTRSISSNSFLESKMNSENLKTKQYYLGEHKVTCKALYRGFPFERGSDGVPHVNEIYCRGKFTISHGQHSFVEYGKEDKVYEIRPAIRHRKKRIYVD